MILGTNMQTGTVKWFNESKGFGFISSNNKDYFVYFKDIQTTGFKTLTKGDEVSFEPSNSEKGLVAKSVSVQKK